MENGKKILHIVPDQKFIDRAYDIFEKVYPEHNKFIIFGNQRRLKYIKKTPIEFVPYINLLCTNYLKSIYNYDVVIFHSLRGICKTYLLLRAPKNVKFIWIGWGYDYYHLIQDSYNDLIKPLTQDVISKNTLLIRKEKKKNITQLEDIIDKVPILKDIYIKKCINRIDFFAPVLYEDYKLLQNSIFNFKPKYLSWNYNTAFDFLSRQMPNSQINGDNFLIGNDSSYANNHFDSFELISNLDIGNRKIVVPLSYGNVLYRDFVINHGAKKFKKNFSPLVDFIAIDEYVNILSSCSVVIMNHVRQKALGTIIIMLYLGAKVFLESKSPIYKFFLREGAIIYSIEDLPLHYKNRLNFDDIMHNRTILENHFSNEIIYRKTKSMIENITES